MRSPRTPSGRGANQVRCKTCHRFLHLWNKHEECVPCSVKSGRTCAPDKTCVICAAWPDDQWALYTHAVRDAQRAPSHPPARRSLQTSGASVADFRTPAWTGPPPGPHREVTGTRLHSRLPPRGARHPGRTQQVIGLFFCSSWQPLNLGPHNQNSGRGQTCCKVPRMLNSCRSPQGSAPGLPAHLRGLQQSS